MKEYISESYYDMQDEKSIQYLDDMKAFPISLSAFMAESLKNKVKANLDENSPLRKLPKLTSLASLFLLIMEEYENCEKDNSYNALYEIFSDPTAASYTQVTVKFTDWITPLIKSCKIGIFQGKEHRYGHLRSTKTSDILPPSDKMKKGLKTTGGVLKDVDVGKVIMNGKSVDFDSLWGKYVLTLSTFTPYPVHFAHACMWAMSMGANKTNAQQMKRVSAKIKVGNQEVDIDIISQIHLHTKVKLFGNSYSMNKIYYSYIVNEQYKKAKFSDNVSIYGDDPTLKGVLRHQYLAPSFTAKQSIPLVRWHYNSKEKRGWTPNGKFNMNEIMKVIRAKKDFEEEDYKFVDKKNLSEVRTITKSLNASSAINNLKNKLVKAINSDVMSENLERSVMPEITKHVMGSMLNSIRPPQQQQTGRRNVNDVGF